MTARRSVARASATRFVASVNETVVCESCGASGVEWHRVVHEAHPNWRVSSLRAQGNTLGRIAREMLASDPLCRRCHMERDGRGAALFAAQPRQPGTVFVQPAPCGDCGREAKPLRRGRCWKCSERFRHGGRYHNTQCAGDCAYLREDAA